MLWREMGYPCSMRSPLDHQCTGGDSSCPLCKMQVQRLVKKIYKWKPIANRRLGRPKNRWEDDILNDLKLVKVNNWMKLIGNWKEWKKVIEKAKTLAESRST